MTPEAVDRAKKELDAELAASDSNRVVNVAMGTAIYHAFCQRGWIKIGMFRSPGVTERFEHASYGETCYVICRPNLGPEKFFIGLGGE